MNNIIDVPLIIGILESYKIIMIFCNAPANGCTDLCPVKIYSQLFRHLRE